MSYKIEPSGVQKTLNATEDALTTMQADVKPLDGYMSSAASSCGDSGVVVGALGVFFSGESDRLDAISKQVDACVYGAFAAASAYVHADTEMAHTTSAAQRRAITSTRDKNMAAAQKDAAADRHATFDAKHNRVDSMTETKWAAEQERIAAARTGGKR